MSKKSKSSFKPDLEVLRSKKQVASEKLKALELSFLENCHRNSH